MYEHCGAVNGFVRGMNVNPVWGCVALRWSETCFLPPHHTHTHTMKITTPLALLVALLVSLVAVAVAQSPLLPRNEDVQYLAARQDASNTTSSSSSSSTSSSSSSTSSSSSSSSTLNITQSSSEDPPSGCSMSNKLSAGQSASWTDTTASSCCIASTSSTCYFRMQSTVSSTERCTIPDCTDLASGDASRMVGFKPLSTTTGSGSQNNTFNITPVNAAERVHADGVWLGAAILACSTLLL